MRPNRTKIGPLGRIPQTKSQTTLTSPVQSLSPHVSTTKPQTPWATPLEKPAPNASKTGQVLQGPLGPLKNPLTGEPIVAKTVTPAKPTAPKPQTAKAPQVNDDMRQMIKHAQRQTQKQIPQAHETWSRSPIETGPHTKPKGLAGEAVSANARTADALLKTTDFSAIKPHIQEAWTNGGAQGRAEVLNLAQQMEQRSPGAGQRFVTEMDLDMQTPPNLTDGPSMNERGNWHDVNGNHIFNQEQNPNLMMASDGIIGKLDNNAPPNPPFEKGISSQSEGPIKDITDHMEDVYRGVIPPEMRQQLEGLGKAGKWTMENLSPGADIRDAKEYSGKASDNFHKGEYLDAVRNTIESGAALAGTVLPGTYKGAKQVAAEGVEKARDVFSSAKRLQKADLPTDTMFYTEKHKAKNFESGYPEWWKTKGRQLHEDLTKSKGPRIVAPEQSYIWQTIKENKKTSKHYTNGRDGKEKRIFSYDRGGAGRHSSEIEVFTGKGKHIGAIDPLTGDWLKGRQSKKDFKVGYLHESFPRYA